MEAIVAAPEAIDVRYWLTDAYVLVALAQGLVPSAPKNSKRDATALIGELQQGISTDRVTVPVSCFLPTKGPAALLGLGGWHAPHPYGNEMWQHQLGERLRPTSAEERKSRIIPGIDEATANGRYYRALEKLVASSLEKFIRVARKAATKA